MASNIVPFIDVALNQNDNKEITQELNQNK
jgi:hypothetical protein